jgi:hypothetical protein
MNDISRYKIFYFIFAEVGYVRSGEKHSTLSQRFHKPEERTVGEDIGSQKAYLRLGS